MKKILSFLLCLSIMVIPLAGCSNNDSNTEEPTTTQEIATDVDTTDDTTVSTEATDTTNSSDDYDFSSYEKKIQEVTKKINNAKTSNDASTNQSRFYELKKELDAIDNSLDSLDDTFEHAYESGDLAFDVYKKRDQSLEKLENKLDLAENALESKFGIDD